MTLSMHQASAPVFLRALANLRHVLQRGEAHASEKEIAPEVLLQTRLIADMLPLLRQVQIVTDLTKNGCARLAGVEPLAFPDDEATFEQLYARIERAVGYVQGFTPEQIDGSESRTVSFKVRTGGEMTFDGQGYLLGFVLPNLYFHSTVAYAILRVAGAPLGKVDFFGGDRKPA